MNFRSITLLLSFFICLSAVAQKKGIKEKQAPDLFDQTIVHKVEIKLPMKDYEAVLDADMEHRNKTANTKYQMAEVYMDGVFYDSAGVRYKGQSSYDFTFTKKKSIKLDFDKFGKGKKHQGHGTINLLNNFKDPTMLRETIYLNEYRKMGLPAPLASFARVYVNGEYIGLYTITEQINDDFCDRVFGNDDGNLYKGQPAPGLVWIDQITRSYRRCYILKEQGDKERFSDLIGLCATIDDPQGREIPEHEYITRLDNALNTKEMLRAWAINNFYMNIDAYNMYFQHNFYIYNNPYSGKFEWINYDGNYSFATWNPNLTMEQCAKFDIMYIARDRYPESLQTKMFEIPYYKRMYLDEYYNLVLHFEQREWMREIERMAAMVQSAVYEDKYKATSNEAFDNGRKAHFGDILDPGAFVPGIFPFMDARLSSVKSQLIAEGYKF